MTEAPRLVHDGLVFGESPRWHDGRLWVSDWGAGHVLRLDPSADGPGRGLVEAEVVARVGAFPMCIDFLPDGRLLVVHSGDGLLLRQEADGSLVTHADLSSVGPPPWNEVVAHPGGGVYVDGIGFDFPDGPFSPGQVVLVSPDGSVRPVADDLYFPNGMALTPDGRTLLVAESYASRITAFDVGDDGGLSGRRVWADLGTAAPDGVCLDAEGALWYADVPHRRCVRVREGGEVTDVVELDRGAFSCVLGGEDGRTLFVVAMRWVDGAADGGQVLSTRVGVPATASVLL